MTLMMTVICLSSSAAVSLGGQRRFGEDFCGCFGHGFVETQQVHGRSRRGSAALLPILKRPVADAEHGGKGALRDARFLAQGLDVRAGEDAMDAEELFSFGRG